MKNNIFRVLLLGGVLVYAGGAEANSVDYSGLEQVFGEPVTTSATGKPQRISETPVSMEIISSKEIQNSGAMDIPQLLRRVAGVEVTRNFKGHADVNIRGFNQPFSNRLLVLINGRQFYMDNFGMTLWSALPIQLSEIQQIEIVRGPNTSLFGFNAASGVVNIITYSPLLDDQDSAEVRVGTQAHKQLSLVNTFSPNEDSAIRVSAGKLLSGGYSRDSMATSSSSDGAINSKSFNIDGEYRLSDVSSLRVEGGYNSQDTDNTVPFYVASEVGSISKYYKAAYTHDTGESGLWTANIYRNEVTMGIDGTRFGGSPGPSSTNQLNVIQLSNLLSIASNHTLRLGTEYRNNSIKGETVGTGKKRFSMDTASANAMWDWRIKEDLSFTNAVRMDYWRTKRRGGINVTDTVLDTSLGRYSRDEIEYSFNSGLLYNFTPDTDLRFSFARGLHIPSLVELARSSPAAGAETYGNPNLETEKNFTVETGIEHKLRENGLTLGGNLFFEKITNVIASTVHTLGAVGGTGGASADVTFENVGDAKAYGVEMVVKGKAFEEKVNWNLNYSYLLSQDRPDGLPDHFIDFEGTQPKHKVNFSVNYTQDSWNLNADAHYVSNTNFRATVGDVVNARRSAKVNNYVIFNTSIGYNISENTTISVDGFNLIDEDQQRPAFSLLAATGGANEIGRTVLLTLKHRF